MTHMIARPAGVVGRYNGRKGYIYYSTNTSDFKTLHANSSLGVAEMLHNSIPVKYQTLKPFINNYVGQNLPFATTIDNHSTNNHVALGQLRTITKLSCLASTITSISGIWLSYSN